MDFFWRFISISNLIFYLLLLGNGELMDDSYNELFIFVNLFFVMIDFISIVFIIVDLFNYIGVIKIRNCLCILLLFYFLGNFNLF